MRDPFVFIAHFNRIEALFWFLAALALPFVVSSGSRKQLFSLVAASCGFILFGITDLLEARTIGSPPAWLWTFKIACGLFLIMCRFFYVGRDNFNLTDRWLLFGIFCLAMTVALIALG